MVYLVAQCINAQNSLLYSILTYIHVHFSTDGSFDKLHQDASTSGQLLSESVSNDQPCNVSSELSNGGLNGVPIPSTPTLPLKELQLQSNSSTPKDPLLHSNFGTPVRTSSNSSPQDVVCFNSNTPSVSPLAEFLVYPTPVRKTKAKAATCTKSARVLTSAESRAFLEEKDRKKKEQEEEKARRKREREERQLAKEEAKRRKMEEREAKKLEKLEEEKKKDSSSVANKKRKELPVKTYPKRQKVNAHKCRKMGQDTCCVCLGQYKDDIDESGCVLINHDWIQCPDSDCGVWSHVQCLEESDGGYICSLCQNVFC